MPPPLVGEALAYRHIFGGSRFAFELPLVTWLLSLLGLVHKSFLRKYRRHALVLIVIISAIITPTGDPFTLTVVSVPLYLLYELSILMIKDKKTDADETDEEKEE